MLDSDQDGFISNDKINIYLLDTELLTVLGPIFQEIELIPGV